MTTPLLEPDPYTYVGNDHINYTDPSGLNAVRETFFCDCAKGAEC